MWIFTCNVLDQVNIFPDKMPGEEAIEEVLDGEEYPDGKHRMSVVSYILDRTKRIWLVFFAKQKRDKCRKKKKQKCALFIVLNTL